MAASLNFMRDLIYHIVTQYLRFLSALLFGKIAVNLARIPFCLNVFKTCDQIEPYIR